MILRAAWCELSERIGLADDWWSDAQAYYGVSRREAIRLGTRAHGRRPNLPGSPTCAPVLGKTWDELWAAHPRKTPADIASFYQEIGSWCVFRQLVRHRGRSFADISAQLPANGTLIEYGSGIAPVSWWLALHRSDAFRTVLVDVLSEHLHFAEWRLWQTIKRVRLSEVPMPGTMRIFTLKHMGKSLMLPEADVAVCLETLEHIPSPILAMRSILGGLKHGSWLVEDFRSHDGDGSPTDLESAALERPAVYRMIRRECVLMRGEPPEAPEGGGIRYWRKK